MTPDKGSKRPHKSVMHLLKFFEYKHLPADRQSPCDKPFYDLARWVSENVPSSNPEQTAALRKLLEAKDCAVRALLP